MSRLCAILQHFVGNAFSTLGFGVSGEPWSWCPMETKEQLHSFFESYKNRF